MSEQIDLTGQIDDALSGSRLDVAAAQLFPQHSRSRLQGWIKSGELQVNGATRRTRDRVVTGELVEIRATVEDDVTWQPEELPLDIVYEDEALLVLNKPAGLVVHPAAGNRSGTLLNALLYYDPGQAALPRAGIVHRLDKDTTGLMVVARTLEAHTHLVNQLQERSVHREYLAVVNGWVTGGGRVEKQIGRHAAQRKKMAVVEHGGKPAITHYRVERRFAHYTALRVELETGRTHQIRVHMAHIKYPLVGDPSYGGRPRVPRGADQDLIDALRNFPRQALHARKLSLVHPASGDQMTWHAPEPEDLKQLLQTLQEFDPSD
ncbi:MAG: 23S rRNA pseudouridine1911/1915/1917 synthase [Halieaceae bacterium]|jgi:23S rRNA pseudouridine1911/1915/1917 synthase